MNTMLDQLKTGKNIRDLLGPSRSTRVQEQVKTTKIEIPQRPPILKEQEEVQEEELGQSEDQNNAITPVSFDVDEMKERIIKMITISGTMSFSLIQYISDDTGVPVEQIMKVCLDILKEKLTPVKDKSYPPSKIYQINNPPEEPSEQPKLALPKINHDILDPLEMTENQSATITRSMDGRKIKSGPVEIPTDQADILSLMKQQYD